MKWTILILILTVGCNQRLNKLNELSDCRGLSEVVSNGWEEVENIKSELQHFCKKGFSRQFRSIVSSDSCTLKKDELIKLMGEPDITEDGVKYPFMIPDYEEQKEKYITLWYKCYSETKSMMNGKIESGQKNIFILIDKETETVQNAFETGL